MGAGAAFKHVHIEASTSSAFTDQTRVNPENYIGTKFDSAGKAIPSNPPMEVRVTPITEGRDATSANMVLPVRQ